MRGAENIELCQTQHMIWLNQFSIPQSNCLTCIKSKSIAANQLLLKIDTIFESCSWRQGYIPKKMLPPRDCFISFHFKVSNYSTNVALVNSSVRAVFRFISFIHFYGQKCHFLLTNLIVFRKNLVVSEIFAQWTFLQKKVSSSSIKLKNSSPYLTKFSRT